MPARTVVAATEQHHGDDQHDENADDDGDHLHPAWRAVFRAADSAARWR